MRRTMILVVCLVSMLLAACAAPGGPLVQQPLDAVSGESDGPVRIGFGAPEFERVRYAPLIEAFNAANPDMQVEFVPIEPNFGSGQLNREWLTSIAAQADTFTSMLIPDSELSSGVLNDLRPLFEADAAFDPADFQPGALLPEPDGSVYLLPHTLNLQTLNYNRDLWDAAGLAEPATGWDWNALLAAAEQLTNRDELAPVYGIDDGRDGLLILQGLLSEAGIALSLDADGRLDLNRPEVAAILAQVAELIEGGVIYQRPAQDGPINFEDIGAHIRDGEVGMWMGGLMMLGGEPPFAVDTAALPVLPRNAVLSRSGYVMSKGTANPEAAWRWLSYLSGRSLSDDTMIIAFGVGFELPARRSLAEQADFWANQPVDRVPVLEAAMGQLEQAPPAVLPQISGSLGSALSDVRNRARAEDALTEMQANLDRQLAELAAAPAPQVPVVQLPEQVVVSENATQINFGSFTGDTTALRGLADRFNQQQDSIFVTIDPPSFSGREFSATSMAEQHACFDWPMRPTESDRPALRDLQPFFDADATFDPSDYPPALLDTLRDGAALYGLPYALQLRALNYNRDLFAAAGLEAPRADWEPADFLEAARLLTNGSGEAQQYGYAFDGSHTDDLLSFLNWNGIDAVADGVPRFSDPAVIQAINAYLNLLRDYSPHTRLQGYTATGFAGMSALTLGQEGRLGMWPSLSMSDGFVMVTLNPGQSTAPDLGIAPPPLGERRLGSSDYSSINLLISAQTSDAEAAACWEWLKFLSAQTSSLQDRFPARMSVAQSPEFLAQARPGAAEVYAAYADVLRNPVTETTNPYAGVDLFWLMRAADRALQGADLERELADAQLLTENYLACTAAGDAPADCAKAVDPEYDGVGPR